MDMDKRSTPLSRLKIILLMLMVSQVQLVKAADLVAEMDHPTCKNVQEHNTFSWADYLVLASMLVISCGVGVFYGCFGNKNASSDDYLLGGSTMGTFPMAMSLAASFVTAIELLGNPAEMYYKGSQFWMICIAFLLVVPITSNLYLPVFMTLRLTSSYEYLSMRFSRQTRYIASALYILQMVIYTSVAVYAPALALSHETSLNVYVAVTLVYVVCIFYASQGGMKAVIIADTFQATVLIGSIIVIVYLGEKYIGNIGIIWSESYNTKRLEILNFDPNPTVRHSFWSVVIGGTFYWMTMFCSNQSSLQKYLSVENIGQVKKALWTSAIGLVLVYTLNFYTGMIMVAEYKDCDPMKSGQVQQPDEILPFYIISKMGHLKGVSGFFVSGIFAASLGTVASALNSLAAVTVQDFVTDAFNMKIPANRGAFVAKCISIGYGALSFALVFVIAQLGSVMQVAISFNGMVGGITLGLFSLGMFFPWANSKGAITGSTIAVVLITVMCIGQQVYIANGDFKEQDKVVRVDGCPCFNETTIAEEEEHDNTGVPAIYRISYIWYSMIGFFVTIIIGLVVSFATGAQDPKEVNGDLLSPPIRNFLNSLSNDLKEKLNIPLKETVKAQAPKKSDFKGIINFTLNIADETKDSNAGNDTKAKARKISAPS